tara:strand:+ start:392 stop:1342 length:951 start_codon:yes stop_codon:yes gene_type:complete
MAHEPGHEGEEEGVLSRLLGPLLGIGTAAGGTALTKSAYDRLGDIGDQAKKEANLLADEIMPMTQFRPFTVTSTTGGAFGSRPTTTTVVDPETGVSREVVTGTEATYGLSPEELALQGLLMGQSQQFLGQSALPMGQREADVYERIRAVQSPEEERQRLMLEERLANQGRLGVRTGMFGGTPEAFAMEKAQAEARNQAALMALQQAQTEQAQAQQMGLAALGGSYLPQAQLLNVQQASQLFPQMQQQAQLFGTGQFGETKMTGIEAQLIAEQARANLLGGLGTGLLGGLFKPVGNAEDGITTTIEQIIRGFGFGDG